jgi:hypothetical protein
MIEAAGDKIPDHKLTNININVRKNAIEAIQSEHKNFNARPDERNEDWIDDLLKMEPSAIEAFQIKVPKTPKAALEYEEPEKPKGSKAGPKPKNSADERGPSRAKSNKPRRVRAKDAHIMNAPQETGSDEREPEAENNPSAIAKDAKKQNGKNIQAPSLGGSGGDEPPEGPPEAEARAEKWRMSRTIQHYEEVNRMVGQLEAAPNLQEKEIQKLKTKLHNKEKVIGINFALLEEKNPELKEIYLDLKSRLDALGKKLQETPGKDPQITSPENVLPPSAELILKHPKTAQVLNDYLSAYNTFQNYEQDGERKSGNEISRMIFAMHLKNEKLAEAINENFDIKFSINDEDYQAMRDEAKALLESRQASQEALTKKTAQELISQINQSLEHSSLELPKEAKEAIAEWLKNSAEQGQENLKHLQSQLETFRQQEKAVKEKEKAIESLAGQEPESLKANEAEKKSFTQKVKESPKKFFAFAKAITAHFMRKERMEDAAASALKAHGKPETSISQEELGRFVSRHPKGAELQASLKAGKNALQMMKDEFFAQLAPVRESREALRKAATQRLQRLMDGDLENLQKANEMLESLKESKILDYFGPGSEEYLDTSEVNKDGKLKRDKQGSATRLGELIYNPEDIQLELNMRIVAEINTRLDNALDNVRPANRGLKAAEQIIINALESGVGNKSKEKAQKTLANILDIKINSLRDKPKENATMVSGIRSLQNKLLK